MLRLGTDASTRCIAGLWVVLLAGWLAGCNGSPATIVEGEQETSDDAGWTVQRSVIDFADVDTYRQLQVQNTGSQDLAFQLDIDYGDGPENWLTASPAAAQCAPGQTITFTLTADRDALPAGLWSAEVGITAGTIRKTVMVAIAVVAATASLDSHDFGLSAGPFQFQVWNAGGGRLDYQVTGAPSWLVVDGAVGTSTGPDDRKTVSISVNRTGMSAGTYSGQLVIDPGPMQKGARKTIDVTMVVPPNLTIQASATSGQAPLAVDFSAMDGQSLAKDLPVRSTLDWDFGDGAAVAHGNTASHTFTSSGTFTVTLSLTLADGLGTVACDKVTVNVADAPVVQPGSLAVSPADGLSATGIQGGPFTPGSVTYTLTNPGDTTIAWTAGKTQDWVSLSKTSGRLGAGASDTVIVSIGAAAGSLAVASYSDTATFTNITNGNGNATRAVVLTLSTAVGPDGWTVLVPSPDSRIVYVSSSQGDDNNSGLSPDQPVKSIPKAMSLVRTGMPDWVLFKCGDSWDRTFDLDGWNGYGRSASEPQLIGSYGSGPRPVFNSNKGGSGTTYGFGVYFLSGAYPIHGVIVGIDLECSPEMNALASPVGINILSPAVQDLLIEDCVINGWNNGIVLNGYAGTIHGISVRRSVINNSYSTVSHSQGLYADNVNGLLLDGNVFDHNGWNEAIVGAEATIFNHNIYVKENVIGMVFRNNISANASSHGLQARSGGDVENNLFINNPIGMSFGYVNGSPITPGGVQGTVAGNVFIGGRDIAGSPRGWAIEISNTRPGGGTTIESNVFTGDSQNKYAAIRLDYGNVTNPAEAVGINDLTIQGNTIFGWNSALSISTSAVPGGTGQYALNNLVVTGNGFQSPLSGLIADHGRAFDSRYETWQGNRYWSSANPANWFRIAGAVTAWTIWQSTIDPTGSSTQISYLDSTRSVASYSASIGGAATVEAFLAAARQQSRQNWDARYTAASVIAYIAGGFTDTASLSK